jgi:hypothetical protein
MRSQGVPATIPIVVRGHAVAVGGLPRRARLDPVTVPGPIDDELASTLRRYLDVVDELAPGVVEGLYLVGSAALGDWHPAFSDVDIVAVTAEPATEDDAEAIRRAHARLAEVRPAPTVDGPYVAWGDLIVEPATGLHRPWVLDGVVHHDGDCYEINPVTWYTLATYGLAARGPSPADLEVALDVEARVRFAVDDLGSYWATLGEQLAGSVGARAFTTADLEWCALGPLRVHYTAFTADVTSKRRAGEHGLAVAPERFHDAIRAALTARRLGTGGVADDADIAATSGLIAWLLDDVRAAR